MKAITIQQVLEAALLSEAQNVTDEHRSGLSGEEIGELWTGRKRLTKEDMHRLNLNMLIDFDTFIDHLKQAYASSNPRKSSKPDNIHEKILAAEKALETRRNQFCHSLTEVANIFGVSRQTIINWEKKGYFPFGIKKTPNGYNAQLLLTQLMASMGYDIFPTRQGQDADKEAATEDYSGD
jgi:DNA-binding XRE family transcriptional regulator